MRAMIERIHLTVLREVERRGSLTSAAKALHLTQSALSHTIKKLEHQLGASLWKKSGRKLELTQAGKYLLTEAKRILPQLEHVDEVLAQYAAGERGTLRIGMECHPCYQWLLTLVSAFLAKWPDVDIDVKQRFQFGGIAALFNRDIDLLVTPDPIAREGITFTPVFEYEQVLVVGIHHPLSALATVEPAHLASEVLYTYPVDPERLDIYTSFLLPANCLPKKRKTVEATEIQLQLVAAHRGVATLPKWLAEQYEASLPIKTIRLGPHGIKKHIHLGTRSEDVSESLAAAMVDLAMGTGSNGSINERFILRQE